MTIIPYCFKLLGGDSMGTGSRQQLVEQRHAVGAPPHEFWPINSLGQPGGALASDPILALYSLA